ncbi:hypothetical protein BGZ95_004519 [Linnemannia exigua]|uniref:RNI-like protein n=1 Tax=Linnemannia exigua TaxID=604196 RepID=A0AAD4H1N2_9FUNG|nr:hypothetical protein BGZ95_004519 [Linnemannia exigua]
MEKEQTSITDLTLSSVTTDDKTITRLLGMTPHITRFEIDYMTISAGDFLASLPVLCPDIKILKMSNCPLIPSSAYMRLFQYRNGLQLEQLFVSRIALDDPGLRLITSTQGDTLQELTIWGCNKITESGFMALLAGCHRLTYLAPDYNLQVPLSIMADDNDDDGDVDDCDGITAKAELETERRRNQWSCYNTLKQLHIISFGVPGLDDELANGFLGVEHQERQGKRGNADQGRNEVANDICEKTTTTMMTTATNSISAISANAATVTGAVVKATWQSLVGPRLRTLKVSGQKQDGYVGEDIDRFLSNFPGLKVFETTKIAAGTEMVERFRKAGVQVRTPDR